MLRTRIEREEELQALRELTGRVPAAGDDGDNNREAIDAQIVVIDEVLTREEIYQRYEADEELLEAALYAGQWLREDDDAPSARWHEEIEVPA